MGNVSFKIMITDFADTKAFAFKPLKIEAGSTPEKAYRQPLQADKKVCGHI